MTIPYDFDKLVADAIGFFWGKRDAQAEAQSARRLRDQGARAAVTGGKQMDGFVALLAHLLAANGVPQASIFLDKRLELPGYFRPTKKWDLLVVHKRRLLAVAELKSQVGPSFGNNFNNRTEEAVGSATDISLAYREGAFGEIRRPWLGYLFMLERSDASTRPVRVLEPHFKVFSVFQKASYARRYEEMCRRLVREGLYQEAAFLTSEKGDVEGQSVFQPAADLGIRPFCESLVASVLIGMKAG
ncbi:MAG: PaeR7I family type II restriction endonuclease [Anaerolineales bacterium]